MTPTGVASRFAHARRSAVMLANVKMPQLGESVREGTIAKWLVQPGEVVKEFQPLLEVDTDKVNAQIPSPFSGTVRELLVAEGAVAVVGADIAVIERAGEERAAASAPPTVEMRKDPEPTEQRAGLVSPAVAAIAQDAGVD